MPRRHLSPLVRPALRAAWLAVLLALPAASLRAETPAAAPSNDGPLALYDVAGSPADIARLRAEGFDFVDARDEDGRRVGRFVLSPNDARALGAAGHAPRLWRDGAGRTLDELARPAQEGGYAVWRDFDGEDGLLAWMDGLAASHPDLVRRVALGTTHQGRPLVALRVTAGVDLTPEGARPAVLFSSLQHAREWIGGEVNRRLVERFVEGYGSDPVATRWLDERELWFLLVANPDGYQHTFDSERLWRKNLRDNDGDGEITEADGVDPNRNFPEHWGYDDEGSEADPSGGTYRGPAPASEPETAAMIALLDRLPFVFHVNFHSVGPLLLYGIGWQVETPSADLPIFLALSGTDDAPAIPGTDPGLSADLYITNGETCDYAYGARGTLCWTPELSDGGSGGGFVFPDDEALVAKELDDVLPFALDLIASAADPARPVSHLGNTTVPLIPAAFDVSTGDPQVVEVNARRSDGPVTAHWSINGGPPRAAAAREWAGGERYGDVGDVHYRRMRATVSGAAPGDAVRVWFTSDAAASEPYTYTLASDSAAPVLVVAAADTSGDVPTDGAADLAAHLDALAANGLAADVWDVDANGRRAPSALGVLAHYEAVLWMSGDDIVPRDAGAGPGTAAPWARDLGLAVRDYLNEGGRLLRAGKYAGLPEFTGQVVDRRPEPGDCAEPGSDCAPLSDDFFQYYLGAHDYLRSDPFVVDAANYAGTGRGWWSGAGDDLANTATRTIDPAELGPGATLSMGALWRIEEGYDYGYVELSTDGGASWATLPDLDGILTDADPNDLNDGWALEGSGAGRLRFDLSPFAAATTTLTLRLRYATDGGLALPGWFVDDLVLEDDGGPRWVEDLEGPTPDWTLEGWSVVPIARAPAAGTVPVTGAAEPFAGLNVSFAPAATDTSEHSGSFRPTGAVYPFATHPAFRSVGAAAYDDPRHGARTGERFVWSGIADTTWQRLTRVVDLGGLAPGDPATLTFWTAYDLPASWNALFVEARTAGGDDWTTLPDRNGHTSPDAARRCDASFWFDPRPQLAHYMAPEKVGEETVCRPEGSTGAWHAAAGASEGWQEWSIDLSAWAGGTVEVSISHLGAYFTHDGVRLDDIALSTGATTSFETDLGGWSPSILDAPGAPGGEPFFPATLADWPYAAAVVTDDTILLGFGIEDVVPAEARDDLVGRAMAWLLRAEDGDGHRALFLPVATRTE